MEKLNIQSIIQEVWSTHISEILKLNNDNITMRTIFNSKIELNIPQDDRLKHVFDQYNLFDVLKSIAPYFNPENQTPATKALMFNLLDNPNIFVQLYITTQLSKNLNEFIDTHELQLNETLSTHHIEALKHYKLSLINALGGDEH